MPRSPTRRPLFLAERRGNIAGSAVFAGMEGTRPVLVEIQALLAPIPLAAPRRSVVGWDQNRLAMMLAVLEARCGAGLACNDVYLNVAGGLRIAEPAADLAVAAALLSALTAHCAARAIASYFGEVGLSGEVRPVAQAEVRLKEAPEAGVQHRMSAGARREDLSERLLGQAHAPRPVEGFGCAVWLIPQERRRRGAVLSRGPHGRVKLMPIQPLDIILVVHHVFLRAACHAAGTCARDAVHHVLGARRARRRSWPSPMSGRWLRAWIDTPDARRRIAASAPCSSPA